MKDAVLAVKFMEVFAGLERAHGVYTLSKKKSEGGDKQKGRATTESTPVTVELWQKHLAGEQGLGVVPIREDNTVVWAAIDVDVYPLDHKALEQRLLELKLPLIVVRSKSGGAHLFLFGKEPLPAKLVRVRLNQWAAMIGYPGVEVFPKQDAIIRAGDVGNWLNMPYFNHAESQDRAAFWDGELLPAAEFIKKVESRQITRDGLENSAAIGDDYFADGPPCLQHLTKNGFPRGTRNRGLFNLGVLARFTADDGWQDMVDDFNRKYMQPPLSTAEVVNTVKSLSRKQYFYTCTQDPIVSVCNKDICRTRKYGIGNDATSTPPIVIDTIAQIDSEPPVYVVKIEGTSFQCNSVTLINQQAFKVIAFEKTRRIIPLMPAKRWESMINEKMENCEIIPAPTDAGPEGQFTAHLENFCTAHVTANKLDEILLGKPFVDATNGRTFFRSPDLLRYLDHLHFREYNERQIWALLKRKGAEHHQFMIKGKCVTAWSVASFQGQTEAFEVPPIEGSDL